MESDQKNSGVDDAQQDKWADLLSGLGIEPSSEEAAKQSDAQTEPEESSHAETSAPPVDPVEHAIPSRPASGWNELASDFGLEVSAPEPESEPPVAATVSDAPQDAAIDSAEDIPAEPDTHDENDERSASAQVETESDATVNEATVVDLAIREVEIEVETDPKSEGFAAGLDTQEKSSPDAEPAAAAGFGAAGLTLPDWFPFGGRKKSKQAEQAKAEADSEGSDSVLDDSEEAPGPDDTAIFLRPTQDAAAESAESLTSDKETSDTDDSSEEQPKRSRRRRGRRRGRGRGRQASETGEEQGESDDASVDSTSDTGGDTHSGEEDDCEAPGKKARSISHKNIPAWQEAIGVVVDANIAARGERKRSNSRGRGGTRGGRGRGRRRSKDNGGS